MFLIIIWIGNTEHLHSVNYQSNANSQTWKISSSSRLVIIFYLIKNTSNISDAKLQISVSIIHEWLHVVGRDKDGTHFSSLIIWVLRGLSSLLCVWQRKLWQIKVIKRSNNITHPRLSLTYEPMFGYCILETWQRPHFEFLGNWGKFCK